MTEAEARAWLVSPERPHTSSRDEGFELVGGGPDDGFSVHSWDCGGVIYTDGRGEYRRRRGANIMDWRPANA